MPIHTKSVNWRGGIEQWEPVAHRRLLTIETGVEMTALHGMNIEEVRQLATRLDHGAQRLEQIAQEIDQLTVANPGLWRGVDADRFRQQWSNHDRVQLRRCAQELTSVAERARTKATTQEQASAAGSGVATAERIPKDEGRLGFSTGREGKYGRDRDLLDLAKASYATGQDRDDLTPGGYSAVTDDELRALGLDSGSFNQLGMSACLFQDPQGNWVLAYRGSDDAMDWLVNNQAGALGVAPGDVSAVHLADAVKAAADRNGVELQFTGHSGGGRSAIAASLSTGGSAVTFNSAPISGIEAFSASGFSGVDASRIRNYVNENDALAVVRQLIPLPGETIVLDPIYRPQGVGSRLVRNATEMASDIVAGRHHLEVTANAGRRMGTDTREVLDAGHNTEALSDGMARLAKDEEEWY